MKLKTCLVPLAAILAFTLADSAAQARHCGACAFPRTLHSAHQSCMPVVRYKVCYQTVCEDRVCVKYRPVYQTTMKECRYTTCEKVYEQCVKEHRYCVSRPIWETK